MDRKVEEEYIRNEFFEVLSAQLKQQQDLQILREVLIRFRDKGMSKESMLECLENMRHDVEAEDVVLELMDFVDGFCRVGMQIFEGGSR